MHRCAAGVKRRFVEDRRMEMGCAAVTGLEPYRLFQRNPVERPAQVQSVILRRAFHTDAASASRLLPG
jgi:hypothetical protein